MICPGCQASAPDGSRYCPACGAALLSSTDIATRLPTPSEQAAVVGRAYTTPGGAFWVGITLLVLIRVGLLATIVSQVVIPIFTFPMTFDTSAWFASVGYVYLAVVAANARLATGRATARKRATARPDVLPSVVSRESPDVVAPRNHELTTVRGPGAGSLRELARRQPFSRTAAVSRHPIQVDPPLRPHRRHDDFAALFLAESRAGFLTPAGFPEAASRSPPEGECPRRPRSAAARRRTPTGLAPSDSRSRTTASRQHPRATPAVHA